jgi:hypothetical protein
LLLFSPLGQILRPHIENLFGPSSILPSPTDKFSLRENPYLIRVSYSNEKDFELPTSLVSHWEDILHLEHYPRLRSMLPYIKERVDFDFSSIIEAYSELQDNSNDLFRRDALSLWLFLLSKSTSAASTQLISNAPDLEVILMEEINFCLSSLTASTELPRDREIKFYRLILMLYGVFLPKLFPFHEEFNEKILELLLLYCESSFKKCSLFPALLARLSAMPEFVHSDRSEDFLLIMNACAVQTRDSDECKKG